MSELVDLEAYQRETDRIIAEFDAKIALIQVQIDSLEVEIATVEGQISLWSSDVENLEALFSVWQQRKKTADFLYDALVRNYKWEINNACEEFNNTWSNYAQIERVATLWLDYVKIWMPPGTLVHSKARSIEVRDMLVSEANQQLSITQSNLTEGRSALSSTQNTLESKVRHMRDLQLAKEADEEEKRGALALWEAEYQASLERKRIEIASITRDLSLNYPTMDAETATNIAKMAYAEALARGFTRLDDTIQIATGLADDWLSKPVIPHYTTRTIFCPTCGIKLEITTSDILADNRDLGCPKCGASVGEGIQVVRIIELKPTPFLGLSIPGAWDWVKKYAPWMGVGTVGVILTIMLMRKKNKWQNL